MWLWETGNHVWGGRGQTPGAGAEEPMSNLSGRSFSSSQTSATDFSVQLRVLVDTHDADGSFVSYSASVQTTHAFRSVTHPTPRTESSDAESLSVFLPLR